MFEFFVRKYLGSSAPRRFGFLSTVCISVHAAIIHP